jgi:hypothetical protein
MKLRTTFNSIRLRIRKSELTTLQEKHKIEESIRFPNGVIFKFGLTINKDADAVNAKLENNDLVILIPKEEAKEWITTNEVGIETYINLPDGEQLHLLIEKDFPCLDRPEEDKSDTFWELAPETPDAC